MDLSSFEIPAALLGILGLSQVVYIAGKLTAAPAISDLNDEIDKLRKAELDLGRALASINTGSFDHQNIPMADDPDVQSAASVHAAWLAQWETTKMMFEPTPGRLVPESAEAMRPPFEVPDIVKPGPNDLPRARRNTPYAVDVTASGGVAPYRFAVAKGGVPAGLTLSAAGVLAGIPTTQGKAVFMVNATDANGASNARNFGST